MADDAGAGTLTRAPRTPRCARPWPPSTPPSGGTASSARRSAGGTPAAAAETAHRDVRDQVTALLAERAAEPSSRRGRLHAAVPGPVRGRRRRPGRRPRGRRRRRVGARAGPGRRAATRELAVGALTAAEVRAVAWRAPRRPDPGHHGVPGPAGVADLCRRLQFSMQCHSGTQSSPPAGEDPPMSTPRPPGPRPTPDDLPGQQHVAEGPLDLNGMYMAHHAFPDLARPSAGRPGRGREVWRSRPWGSSARSSPPPHTRHVLWPQLLEVADAEGRATSRRWRPSTRSSTRCWPAAGFAAMARRRTPRPARLADAEPPATPCPSTWGTSRALPLVQAARAEGWQGSRRRPAPGGSRT